MNITNRNKSNSNVRNYPKFSDKNNKSISKEKLYTTIPKNIYLNTNNNRDSLMKSPSLKISSKLDQLGNRQININFFEKQQTNTISKVNNNPIMKNHSVNNFFNSMTCENDNLNLNNNGNMETETDKINIKLKINSEVINNNIKINSPTNNMDIKEINKKNISSTQVPSTKNIREFAKINKMRDENIHNNINSGYVDLIKEKEREIEKLKNELNNIKNFVHNKPQIVTNDIKINENFINSNLKSLSTSNKSNSKSIFKFDTKNNISEKVEVFSDRSPNMKNLNNFNNFNNNFVNKNLTNRNSYNSKNFLEIFHKYNKNNNNRLNNLSKSTNFNGNNGDGNNINNKSNSKAFSSTFSNFFRKSNKKNSDTSSSLMRDGLGKTKSSHKSMKTPNQSSTNTNLNSNSFGNINILNQNFTNNSNGNFNPNFINQDNNYTRYTKNINEIEANNEVNFSDIVTYDEFGILNLIKNKSDIRTNQQIQHNNSNGNNELQKKNSSRLEIKDLENYESDFRNLNNLSQKNLTSKNRNNGIKGKSLSSLTSNSQVNIKDLREKDFSYNENYIDCNVDPNEKNIIKQDQIFERLNNLKVRTKEILAIYADSYIKRK